MKKYLSALLALGMALSVCACGAPASDTADNAASGTDSASTAEAADTASADADSDLAYIQGKGKMTIGYTVYEPMNYTDENGTFTGFDTELATAVCEKLGVEPDFAIYIVIQFYLSCPLRRQTSRKSFCFCSSLTHFLQRT